MSKFMFFKFTNSGRSLVSDLVPGMSDRYIDLLGSLMILIIAVLNWEIRGNALRDASKLFHSLTQKG